MILPPARLRRSLTANCSWVTMKDGWLILQGQCFDRIGPISLVMVWELWLRRPPNWSLPPAAMQLQACISSAQPCVGWTKRIKSWLTLPFQSKEFSREARPDWIPPRAPTRHQAPSVASSWAWSKSSEMSGVSQWEVQWFRLVGPKSSLLGDSMTNARVNNVHPSRCWPNLPRCFKCWWQWLSC